MVGARKARKAEAWSCRRAWAEAADEAEARAEDDLGAVGGRGHGGGGEGAGGLDDGEVGGAVDAEGEGAGPGVGLAEELAEAAEEALAGGDADEAVGGAVRDGSFVVGGADVAEVGARNCGKVAEVEGGVAGAAELLRVDALQAGEGFAVAARGDGGEGLAVAFVGAEGAEAGRGDGVFGEVVAGEVAPEAGGVGLERGAVVVVLVEQVPGEEETGVRIVAAPELGAVGLAADVGGGVDGAGERGAGDDVAGGTEAFAGEHGVEEAGGAGEGGGEGRRWTARHRRRRDRSGWGWGWRAGRR